MKQYILILFAGLCGFTFCHLLQAQVQPETFVVGDALPDAPELSPRGTYAVGVQTVTFVNKGQVDILKSKEGSEPKYDRPLKVEIWYPATLPGAATKLVSYESVLGRSNDPKRPIIPFNFTGRAVRDAAPNTKDGTFPLVIVSHGYPGSRYLLTYLTENLASKGYVVAAIDHTESTYQDLSGFQSTLLNRPKDILFVLNQLAELSKPKGKHFLSGLADASNTALIGYSMGGYGVLNVAGAGYSSQLTTFFTNMTGGSKAIEVRTSQSPEYKASMDSRIKAIVAFAPWGMERGIWDSEGLQGLKTPTFFIAGSQDDVSGYEKGVKAIYTGSVNADRYMLVYVNARHNVAPNPPPAQTLQPGMTMDEYYHYAEPAWNERRINNINQHFVTAFLGIHLKKQDFQKYLQPESDTTKPWPGFKPRTSVGLELLHDSPVK
ncbi:dienelactone hydrolase [Rhodocytophaga rosea]|uniref:Dienelactone hydrolase n=1 Tax=Rhodocytophaga rosea TaxID=2704465 RepID=A0A6C0GC34_9BACT|nr:dienelactone hydrolase [Rhodocytophaga rosea]QHT65539.1 dienelactone hydrolase [Rhodocytophaga rosea]